MVVALPAIKPIATVALYIVSNERLDLDTIFIHIHTIIHPWQKFVEILIDENYYSLLDTFFCCLVTSCLIMSNPLSGFRLERPSEWELPTRIRSQLWTRSLWPCRIITRVVGKWIGANRTIGMGWKFLIHKREDQARCLLWIQYTSFTPGLVWVLSTQFGCAESESGVV